MDTYHWYGIAGLMMLATVLLASRLKPLPVTTTIIYLTVGLVLGPLGWGALHLDLIEGAAFLEIISEIVVIVSLFSVGLKIRVRFSWDNWDLPLRLILISMPFTIGFIAFAAHWLLGLPVGAAVLLGAILAPTDPVLASDVQLPHPHYKDRLRFSLTSEAGMNDGAAFPFVMLGLGLMGFHELGEFGWRWMLADLLWAMMGGLGVGALLGMLFARWVIYLRQHHSEALGGEALIGFGLLLLSYSVANLLQCNGFLAVFAAGVAVRTIERRHPGDTRPSDLAAKVARDGEATAAGDSEVAPAYMARAILHFNEQTETLLQLILVMLVGGLLAPSLSFGPEFWFIGLLFCVIRPAAVFLGFIGSGRSPAFSAMIGWFGVRGITSIYYLAHLHNFDVPERIVRELVSVTVLTIVLSIFLHGATVTPLLKWYDRASGSTHRTSPET